jgi:hypothetical protein
MQDEISLKEYLEEKFRENKESHDEIIKHQKHTNGDVSALKVWQGSVVGGLAVACIIGSSISALYFAERKEQREKNEQIIRISEQISVINNKLDNWEYAEK